MALPSDNIDSPERTPCCESFQGFVNETSRAPKFETSIAGQACMQHCRSNQDFNKFEYASNPYFCPPSFCQVEWMSSTTSNFNLLQWVPPDKVEAPQTVAPADIILRELTDMFRLSDSESELNSPHLTIQSPSTPVQVLGSLCDTKTTIRVPSKEPPECSRGSVYGENSPQNLRSNDPRKQPGANQVSSYLTQGTSSRVISKGSYNCKVPGCEKLFKRREHLTRHMENHSKKRTHVCWVPGCHRAFTRLDNLNVHYTKTHSKTGGRNRYVATLDKTSPFYDPLYRGPLTPGGQPVRSPKV